MANEQYLQAGVHIGMRQQTKDMRKFIYKVRDDGLAVLNVAMIEERIKIAAKFLNNYQRIMVASRKPAGQKPATTFAQATGSKSVTGRFLPGTITNPAFEGYFEPQVIIVTDPLIDKQAIVEAMKQRIPIIALCDSFNETSSVDFVIPCNNKGRKALAMVFWALSRELLKLRGTISKDEEFALKPEDFESAEDTRERRPREERGGRFGGRGGRGGPGGRFQGRGGPRGR